MRKWIDRRKAGGRASAVFKACLLATALIGGALACARPAMAQVIVSSINGDPITNIDIDQRMKLLRVLRQPATREAAIESLYADRLKIQEASKYGVNPKDSDLSTEIVKVAQDAKIQPEALLAALQHAGVSQDHLKGYFRANLAFTVLVQALNKGVEASETQVREELAKQGGKGAGIAYTVQQIIFTLPTGASPATFNARAHDVEQLRARFTDCDSGIPLARAINDVTVRDPLIRTSLEINQSLRELLDKTPVGHLTQPSRTPSGLEMVAVCAKGPAKDDTAARQAVAQKLLAAKIAEDSARRLKELRERAVIVKAAP
ncbi:MAG: hypothetical protein ACLPSF_06310 [Methylocella sp.]